VLSCGVVWGSRVVAWEMECTVGLSSSRVLWCGEDPICANRMRIIGNIALARILLGGGA